MIKAAISLAVLINVQLHVVKFDPKTYRLAPTYWLYRLYSV